MREVKPNIIAYFTLDSILGKKGSNTSRLITDHKEVPKYMKDSRKFYISNEFLKKIKNFNKRDYIQTVLFVPFSEGMANEVLNIEIDLKEYFSRVYYSNKLSGDNTKFNNLESILMVKDILKGEYYEYINKEDISPTFLLYPTEANNDQSKLLLKLKEKGLCYSYYQEEGYIKIYLNNIYQSLMKKDLVYNSNKNTFSLFLGSNIESIRFVQEASIGIIPYDVISRMGNHETNHINGYISTIKIVDQDKELDYLYPLEACVELKAFVNKMIYN